ncbi:YokU family protein [Paenibacillus sp. P26]|nr:YokU family protein [Paenibacillus sp. P26]UUZ92698.1 YokU family protein [Paenibacillus sp. P25]
MKCEWCEAEGLRDSAKDCYWILPDGKTAVEITDVPALDCPGCGVYVAESVSQQVEEALYWNDVSGLGLRFSYEALMNAPRIAKSYFR